MASALLSVLTAVLWPFGFAIWVSVLLESEVVPVISCSCYILLELLLKIRVFVEIA
jgi:hypothetical protein